MIYTIVITAGAFQLASWFLALLDKLERPKGGNKS